MTPEQARPAPEPPPGVSPRPRIAVVMPAYNAEKTLARTWADIPMRFVDDVILVDDASRDRTVEEARR
ncbi:MAG TPA: glycosyltransferase, partial [Thermoanaerobaculia bacterium]|nr:glycosyltransferase [Thermoanaerobaculia bacterium]